MLVLTIRTDKPEAEIGLYQDNDQLTYETWEAHRQLSLTIHTVIKEQLTKVDKDWQAIKGIIFYQGPGSFTGLRIGASVANALASGLEIPIVATAADEWISQGLSSLHSGNSDKLALPEYGAAPNTTTPRK